MLLEALAAVGAVAGLIAAAWRGAAALVAPATFGASALSLTVSAAGVLGSGRTSGWLSLVESFALLALVFLALRRAPARSGAVAAALAAVSTVAIIPAHVTASDSLWATVTGMAVWGCGALVAAGAARYLDALDVRRARSVADARREQRLSLARDLHDFVAHDVSAIVVQAQAAQVVGDGDPQHARAALERIEQAGLHALGAMDQAVEALRDAAPAQPPGDHSPERSHAVEDLRELAARFAATGSLSVEVEIDDERVSAMSSQLRGAAYRLVSEALTNVRRHAPAATCIEVRVVRSQLGGEPAITVCVVNDGVPPRAAAGGAFNGRERQGGFGLAGLRERVEALGGTLQAGPDEPGGWRLTAVLPAATQHEEP